MLVFFALGNAKVLSFALADAKVANASSFAFWWNIGFSVIEVELFALHVYLICAGLNCHRNIRKTYSVIRALK